MMTHPHLIGPVPNPGPETDPALESAAESFEADTSPVLRILKDAYSQIAAHREKFGPHEPEHEWMAGRLDELEEFISATRDSRKQRADEIAAGVE